MENAVKALIIVAGVLIGAMILSLGVSLYSSLGEYVQITQEGITSKEIQRFNGQFTKYINYNSDTGEFDFTLTIQDIVTAANTAYENNTNDDYYVTINMTGYANLERTINSNSVEVLQNGLGKEYKCTHTDVKFDSITGRVCEVNFYED